MYATTITRLKAMETTKKDANCSNDSKPSPKYVKKTKNFKIHFIFYFSFFWISAAPNIVIEIETWNVLFKCLHMLGGVCGGVGGVLIMDDNTADAMRYMR